MITKRTISGMGWRPDTPDFRDHLFRDKVMGPARVDLPPTVDLRPSMPPVYDQGELGSCTANAIAAAMEQARIKAGHGTKRPSRLQIYYGEREIEGTISQDAGAEIRDGIKVVANTGAALESLWPYKIDRFARKPTKAAMESAAIHKVSQYSRVCQTKVMLQTALAMGHPVIFGFSVYSQFESDRMAKDGVLMMPESNEQMIGGHAVLMVGYTVSAGLFYWIVRNSWGPKWGMAGYFMMAEQYPLDPNLADDFWTLNLAS